MPLYSHTITIFNYDYEEEKYYPTLINKVECQYYFGINRLPEYNVSTDRCLCIIKYQIIDGKWLYSKWLNGKYLNGKW